MSIQVSQSRFAVLRDDEEDISIRKKQQQQQQQQQLKKQQQQQQKDKKSVPSGQKAKNAKKKTKDTLNSKQKINSDDKQWQEWKEADEKAMDTRFTNDLKQALVESNLMAKLENKSNEHKQDNHNNNTSSNEQHVKKKSKSKAKKPVTTTLSEFLSSSSSAGDQCALLDKQKHQQQKHSQATTHSATIINNNNLNRQQLQSKTKAFANCYDILENDVNDNIGAASNAHHRACKKSSAIVINKNETQTSNQEFENWNESDDNDDDNNNNDDKHPYLYQESKFPPICEKEKEQQRKFKNKINFKREKSKSISISDSNSVKSEQSLSDEQLLNNFNNLIINDKEDDNLIALVMDRFLDEQLFSKAEKEAEKILLHEFNSKHGLNKQQLHQSLLDPFKQQDEESKILQQNAAKDLVALNELLQKELIDLRIELQHESSKNKKLISYIKQCKLKDKVKLINENEKLTEINAELNDEVNKLHVALEQEKSKVHEQQTKLNLLLNKDRNGRNSFSKE